MSKRSKKRKLAGGRHHETTGAGPDLLDARLGFGVDGLSVPESAAKSGVAPPCTPNPAASTPDLGEAGRSSGVAYDRVALAAHADGAPHATDPMVGAHVDMAIGAAATAASVAASNAQTDLPLGQRLRAAREARGWSAEELARTTHLSGTIVAAIEAGRFDRLGAVVYARGYLRTYARAVGVSEAVVDLAPLAAPVEPELMRATPLGAPPRKLATRYTNPVIYAVLTVAVIVPLFYLARGQQELPATPTLTALDGSVDELITPRAGARRADATVLPFVVSTASTPAASDDAAGDIDAALMNDAASGGFEQTPAAPAQVPVAPAVGAAPLQVGGLQQPVLASLASLPPATRGTRRVVLRLDQPSWVEIVGRDGFRIERALLPAGAVREYQISAPADVQIGNTRGAHLVIDGNEVDLGPHTRGNVARLVVGADGSR